MADRDETTPPGSVLTKQPLEPTDDRSLARARGFFRRGLDVDSVGLHRARRPTYLA